MTGEKALGERFERVAGIMARLRAPGGCPWDREQTPESIRKYTLEETYEVLDAIERKDWANLQEELGDLLLQVLFYAEMAEEAGYFGLAGVLDELDRKLIRRHPHVFGEAASTEAGFEAQQLVPLPSDGKISAERVVSNWHLIKRQEKQAKAVLKQFAAKRSSSLLDDIPRAQGAMSEAAKLGKAAARIGFDWSAAADLIAKVREEAGELEAEIAAGEKARLHEETGDLLFTVVNLARHLKVDPEMALRDANAKFRRRFAAMEHASAQPLEKLTTSQLEEAWAEVKSRESSGG